MLEQEAIPHRFTDASGRKWLVTGRIPGHLTPMRTKIDAETAGADYPDSCMVSEESIRREISALNTKEETSVPQSTI